MKTVVITKSKWHTQGGKTFLNSELRSRESKRMCCLGFAAQQAGCTGLTGVGEPSCLPVAQYEKFLKAYPKINCDALIDINDNHQTTRAEKAKKIQEAGLNMGVNFVFV